MTDGATDPEPRHEWLTLSSGVDLHTVHWDPTGAPGSPTAGDVPVLLVHGLASNARLWDGVALHLARRGHRVVAVDQRGHGRSSKPDDGYDMANVANDLRLLIDELGWTPPQWPASRGAATSCWNWPGPTRRRCR